MDKVYYQEYFDLERKHWWFRARKDIIESHLNKIIDKKTPLKILNIGVSTGHTSELLMQFGEVTSVEYDKECIEFTKSKIDIEMIEASILELPFEDQSFDLVCAFDVIEHVDDDQLAMNEMVRVCKAKGSICATVPAFMFLWSHHDEVNHHYRRYRKKELLELYPSNGKFLFHTYFNFWLFFLIAPVRLIIKLFPKSVKNRKGSGSDFSSPIDKNSVIEKLFYKIFRSETLFFNQLISLPVGVSVLSSWKKG